MNRWKTKSVLITKSCGRIQFDLRMRHQNIMAILKKKLKISDLQTPHSLFSQNSIAKVRTNN